MSVLALALACPLVPVLQVLLVRVLLAALLRLALLVLAISSGVLLVLGRENGLPILRQYGPRLVEFAYWWAIPGAQLALGMFVMDTWQYFLHRAMHMNRWLYGMRVPAYSFSRVAVN